MQSEASVNLNNDITTSLRLRYTPKYLKISPPLGENSEKLLNKCVISLFNVYLLITVGKGGIYHVYAYFVAWVHTKKPSFYWANGE